MQLLEAFQATEVFSGGGSRIGFVPSCEGNLVEVVMCLVMAWIDEMKAMKRAASRRFTIPYKQLLECSKVNTVHNDDNNNNNM